MTRQYIATIGSRQTRKVLPVVEENKSRLLWDRGCVVAKKSRVRDTSSDISAVLKNSDQFADAGSREPRLWKWGVG